MTTDNNPKAALLPCPFCGGRAEHDTDDLGAYGIRCMDCTIYLGAYSTQKRATQIWNLRSPSAVSEGDAEDFDERCDKRDDGLHCNCWYDGEPCCGCGAPASNDDDETAKLVVFVNELRERDPGWSPYFAEMFERLLRFIDSARAKENGNG